VQPFWARYVALEFVCNASPPHLCKMFYADQERP